MVKYFLASLTLSKASQHNSQPLGNKCIVVLALMNAPRNSITILLCINVDSLYC